MCVCADIVHYKQCMDGVQASRNSSDSISIIMTAVVHSHLSQQKRSFLGVKVALGCWRGAFAVLFRYRIWVL